MRKSNLELLRIIAMLAIIAHHYVVNSGITDYYDFSNINANMIFLQLWGAWGKSAINCFVLISGYFMCTSQLTWDRYCKIYVTAKFYKIVLFVFLAIMGYQIVTFKSVFELLFCYLLRAGEGFTGSFLVFSLFIPFYNILLKGLDKMQLKKLVTFLLFWETIVPTFLFNESLFNPIVWYITLYFIAAYIKLYADDWMHNSKVCRVGLVFSFLVSAISIIVFDYMGTDFGFTSYYHMVGQSNRIFALLIGVFSFLFFLNLKMNDHKIINRIASTTFGVLCIHANSDAMRAFLWKSLLKVSSQYENLFWDLVLHSIVSMVAVFVVCSIIELCRQRFLGVSFLKMSNESKVFIERFVDLKRWKMRIHK